MRFRDRRDRVWPVRLDLAAAARMRDLAGIDPVEPDSGWLEKLNSSPEPLIDALYAVVEPLATRRGVDDVAFGKLLKPAGVLKEAAEAFDEAVEAFFPPAAEAPPEDEDAEGPPGPPLPQGWRMVFEFAGFCGVDPGPRTLRELLWMTAGRKDLDSRVLWPPAAQVASAVFLTRGVRLLPTDINPYQRPPEAEIPTGFVDDP